MSPSTPSRTALLVDLDGTLVDSNYHHALAWWRAFREAGHDVSVARLHKLIGMGGDQLLDTVLGRQDDALEAAQSQHFRKLRDEVTPFPDAARLLAAVAARGITIVLATSSQPADVEHMRRLLGADESIHHEVNASDLDVTKPAPDVFEAALDRAGVGPQDGIVLGDTGWDIDAAARCGLRCVGVTSGGWSRLDLDHRGAVEVYEDVSDVLAHLDTGMIGRVRAG